MNSARSAPAPHTPARPPLLLAAGPAVTATAVAGILALTAALAATMGALTADPSGLGAAAVVLTAVLPLAVLGALGEEVVWRSHLPRTVGGSFWKRSAVVALAWTGFQAPLLLTAVLQGALSASVAAAVLLLLPLLSLLLSALAARQGSVWPAAVAHALILAVIVAAPGVATTDPLGLGAVVLIGGALLGSAAMGVAPADAAAHARPRHCASRQGPRRGLRLGPQGRREGRPGPRVRQTGTGRIRGGRRSAVTLAGTAFAAVSFPGEEHHR